MNETKPIHLLLALGLFAVSGCATGLEYVGAPGPRPLGREFATETAARVSSNDQAPVNYDATDRELTLRTALSLALENNPRLAAYSWEVRAREAALLQAGLFPNPELSVEVENFNGSDALDGFDSAESTVVLSQLVELGGKRAKRQALASLARDTAGWDYEAARIDTFTAVAVAFVDVLASQDRVTLAEQLVVASGHALSAVGDRVKAGAVSAVEKSRAEVAQAASTVEASRRRRELDTARTRLAATWGSTEAMFSRAVGGLEAKVTVPPSRTALFAEVDENPDVARWITEIASREAALALARAEGVPDVTLGGGPRWFEESDESAFVVALSVPFPIFDRNQGATAEARHRLAKANEERRAADVGVRTALASAYGELASAYETVVTLQTRVIPKATEAHGGAGQAFRRGVFRYLDYWDAQRTLFELRAEYIDSLAAYHVAVARVERLIGRSLESIREEEGGS